MIEIVSIVFKQVLIMFIFIEIGRFSCKKNILTEEATKVYSNLLLTIVAPALLIDVYQKKLIKEQLAGLAVAFFFAILFHILAIFITNIFIKTRENENYKIERVGAIYSNCGFMAFPILYATLGETGAFYGTAFAGIFNVFFWTNGVMTLSKKGSLSLKKILINPGTMGFLIGIILYLTQIHLPSFIGESISLLASINTPLAMIIIGVFLAKIEIKELFNDFNIYRAAIFRTIVLPLVMIFIIKIIGVTSWFGDGEIVAITTVIACACPSAVSTILFVSKMDLDSKYGAKIVAMSTIFSLFTMPMLTLIMKIL